MEEEYAKYLLSKTQRNYNRIASHFSNTRGYVWKDLEYFKKFVKNEDKILDLGCGNGRLLKIFKGKNIEYVGTDSSKKLIEIAKKNQKSKIKNQNEKSKFKNIEFIKADALELPFLDNSFDKVFSIAVFHHIPSKKFRLQFLKEAKRVLKTDGLLILTVWNLWQIKFLKKCVKPGFTQIFLKLIGKSQLDFKDIFYPWKNPDGEILAQRYIHCFTKGELKKLVKKAGLQIKEIEFLESAKRNIYVVTEKRSP